MPDPLDLDALRRHLDRGLHARQDVADLIDEVARLRAQRTDAERLEALAQRHGRIRVDGWPGERWRITWVTDGRWIDSSAPTLSSALDVAEGWGREEESHD